jgi:hypothetical protein
MPRTATEAAHQLDPHDTDAELYAAAMEIHSALHAVDEGEAEEFADTLGLSDRSITDPDADRAAGHAAAIRRGLPWLL